MKKILAILLTFFSLYTTLQSYMGLYRYSNALLSPGSQQYIAETNLVSWIIIIVHFLQMVSFFILSYYGASVILNVKREYDSKFWLYIGVFSALLYILEYIAWSMPLAPVEGFDQSKYGNFIERLSDSLAYHSKHNIFQFLTYATFFGIYSKFKKEAIS